MQATRKAKWKSKGFWAEGAGTASVTAKDGPSLSNGYPSQGAETLCVSANM